MDIIPFTTRDKARGYTIYIPGIYNIDSLVYIRKNHREFTSYSLDSIAEDLGIAKKTQVNIHLILTTHLSSWQLISMSRYNTYERLRYAHTDTE